MNKPRTQKPMSDEAVKARTGKVWSEWYEILDKAGAKKWKHQEISAYLSDTHKVGPWWAQMIAVPYEHARGLREKFQNCAGEFSASGSRTLNVPMAKLFSAWTDEKLRRRWRGRSLRVNEIRRQRHNHQNAHSCRGEHPS